MRLERQLGTRSGVAWNSLPGAIYPMALGEGTLFSSRGITRRALHLKKISCMEGDLEGGRDLRQGSQLAAREVTGCPDHPSRGDEGGGGEDIEGGGGQCWQVGAQGSVCSALGLHLRQNFVLRLP